MNNDRTDRNSSRASQLDKQSNAGGSEKGSITRLSLRRFNDLRGKSPDNMFETGALSNRSRGTSGTKESYAALSQYMGNKRLISHKSPSVFNNTMK
jgi:hypothetical protein